MEIFMNFEEIPLELLHFFEPVKAGQSDVWTISTQPFAKAHFATFPEKLVENCLLAGTSPKACPKCGAPWGRIVEISRHTDGRKNLGARHGKGYASSRLDHRGKAPSGLIVDNQTIGWQPTCSCEPNDGSGKCIVLDPFAGGSGRVGKVTLRHGRKFMGIEIKPEYCEMSREEIEADAPLFNKG